MGIMNDIKSTARKWKSTNAESGTRPLLSLDVSSRYGATASSSLVTSPERFGESPLNRVPEEDETSEQDGDDNDDDWELEQQGLYRGSYKRIITLYALVPLSAILTFTVLAVLPIFTWPNAPSKHPPGFPEPIPELLLSASLWSLSYLIRIPLFSFFSLLTHYNSGPAIILSTVFHELIHNFLRLSALPLLNVRHRMVYLLPTWRDLAFYRIWWLALGWSLADAVVSVIQGYEQIALYKDVLVSEALAQGVLHGEERGSPALDIASPRTITQSTFTSSVPARNGKQVGDSHRELQPLNNTASQEVEHDIEQLVALRTREELEEVYGMPVIRIPVFVSCLQRVNSIILSLGVTLLLSSAYLRSPLSGATQGQDTSNCTFYITFPIVVTLHAFLSLLHTPVILPHIGTHVAAYAGVLLGLGSFFAGLAMWDALS